MALKYHPAPGTILICDYNSGFCPPEMVKRRLAVVVSPQLKSRNGLCTVVPLSTTDPDPPMPYHYLLRIIPAMPPPYDSEYVWVKGDMIATVSFARLTLPHRGKDARGKRQYVLNVLDEDQLCSVRKCILNAIGLKSLTGYL